MNPALRRSLLYVPASNARAMEKARSLPCDAIIVDLEDAVPVSAKDAARATAVEAIRARAFGERDTILRVNGLHSPSATADLEAAKAARPDAVLTPKIAVAADVATVTARLAGAAPLWAMIETCRAVLRLDEIAGAPGVEALVFGANDLLAEMGARETPDRQPLQAALALTVMAARAHGLAVFDGVFNDLADEDGLAAECRQGAAYGFDGKTLIHPGQIAPCHAAFSPSSGAVRRARAIVAAFDGQGDGAVRAVDGRMTETLHLEAARRLLAIHEAASRTDPA